MLSASCMLLLFQDYLLARNSSVGGILSGGQVTKGPARALGGVRGVPAFFPHPPPSAAEEKRDLNSYDKGAVIYG